MPPKIYIDKKQLEKLVNSKPLNEIAEIYNCHPETIKRKIRQYNIFRTMHSHLIDHYYFQKWSSNMAYILGFIFADGNVKIDKKNNHYNVTIELKSEDKIILDFIRSEIQPSINLHKYDRYNSYVLSFSSKQLVKDLINLGCHPNKTYEKISMPEIPKQYQSDFIRGYFDGDGTVGFYKRKNRKSLKFECKIVCNNKEFLKSLRDLIGCGKIYCFKSDNGLATLKLNKAEGKLLYSLMYNGNFNLKRKKDIFDEL